MTKHTDAKRFLQAVFGDDYERFAIFANLNPAVHTRTLDGLDIQRGCYWSLAAFGPEAATHVKGGGLEVRAFVIDDVGTKVPEDAARRLGQPTAITETSFMNFQWAYRLSTPVAIEQWRAFAEGVRLRIGCDLDSGYTDPVHLFRLPMGVNAKRGGFPVALVELNAGVTLDTATITAVAAARTGAKAAATEPSSSTLAAAQLEALMRLVPNDLDRQGWVEVGHGLKALCAEDDEGFAVFDAWSAAHDSYDAGKTRTAWDSFGAGGGLLTKGGMLRARAEAADPERFRNWDAKAVFDDDAPAPPPPPAGTGGGGGGGSRTNITATPYQWVDPDRLPPRDWLYGTILIRRFISMTVAPGGVGKSSLTTVETLAQVTGRNLLGEKPAGALRVWLWNLEDPLEETQRRIQAAALHYGIGEADIGGRLFVDSGRDQRLVIAQMDRNGGPMIVRPVVDDLVAQIRALQIDVLVVDPFVSCHEVPENDNTAQDMVVKEWGRVSGLGGCAVHLIDHTRKSMGGAEVTTESSRGGKAKTDAARVVRVVNRMSDADSVAFGVLDPWRYFNTFNDKANMAPPVDRRDWFYLESVMLGNGGSAAAAFSGGVGSGVVPGDSVGVAIRWVPPTATDLVTGDNFKKMVTEMGTEEWRKDPRTGDKWIGVPASRALGLLLHSPRDRKQINDVLSAWFRAGLLKELEQLDDRRRLRKFIQIAGGF